MNRGKGFYPDRRPVCNALAIKDDVSKATASGIRWQETKFNIFRIIVSYVLELG
jgi:hypothetical protein